MTEPMKPLPLPAHPMLAAWASTLNDAGCWAYVFDAEWRYVFQTDELRSTFEDMRRATAEPTHLGSHVFSSGAKQYFEAAIGSYLDAMITELGPYVLATTSGGREELRRIVDPGLADRVDELQPKELPPVWLLRPEWTTAGADTSGMAVWIRIDDDQGQLAGFVSLSKPAAGMSHLARAAAIADLAHLERMRLVTPDRRPAAILMADLEASSPLARRLSSAQYFGFARRLVRMADQCIIDTGGIIGRHAGDGVVAFFLADTAGSESAAARACITAARSLRDSLDEIAARSEIPAAELSLRFGLHWGATLYIGQILTAGRSEVTALGDEVNEAARIEACATGGRTLASKSLVERLNRADADALGVDTSRTTYTPLADLATATDKARRDAPSIAVCAI